MLGFDGTCRGQALFILLFTMTLLGVQPAAAAEELERRLSKAAELINHGKAGSAASILKRILVNHPDNSRAHMMLGAALAGLAQNDEYSAAIAEEQTALKLDPKSYWAAKFLGQMYSNMHKWDDAISMLKQACANNPKSYAARRDLGIAQMWAGKDDEAVRSFRAAMLINKTKPDAHIKLSGLLLKKDDNQGARKEAKMAVKLDVSNPESHLALANAILASGDKIASIESYENAIQANMSKRYRNPLTAAGSLSGLGWAFATDNAGREKLAEAISYQRQAIRIFPQYGPAYIRLAELLGRQGDMKSADSVYKASLQMSQNDAGVSTAYAKFLARAGRFDEARLLLKNVLEKTPDCKQAAEALAKLDNERAS